MDSRMTIRLLLALVVLFLANGCASLMFGELTIAARDGDLAKVKTLVESDPACVRGRGETAISSAASGGHIEIVRYLLSKGADVNVHEKMEVFASMTPLLLAAGKGHIEVVRFLIENGAEVNSLPDHVSPLFLAAYEGRQEVAELLIAKGANVNAVAQSQVMPGGTPLHAAVAKNHVDLVNILLRNGANVNARQNNGTTPLEIALKNRSDTIAAILKTHGTVGREKPKEGVILGMGARPPGSTANEIRKGARFIAYSNGTVQDTITNLMWAAKDNGSDINWANAKSYCDNYRVGGYTDWRMPTQDELAGLYDADKSRPGACYYSYKIHVATELIDITCFISWASETRGSDAAYFNFGNGDRYWGPQFYTSNFRVIPVRSGKAEGSSALKLHPGLINSVDTANETKESRDEAALYAEAHDYGAARLLVKDGKVREATMRLPAVVQMKSSRGGMGVASSTVSRTRQVHLRIGPLCFTPRG